MNIPSTISQYFRASGLLRIALIASLVGAAFSAAAVPAFADSPAPKSDDPHLLLWLDAADAGTLAIAADGHVASWTNKAKRVGGKFTSDDRQRPLYVEKALGGRPALRFDGIDDILRDSQFGRSVKAWTLFVVTTPRSNKGNGQFHGIFSACRKNTDDFVSGLNLDLGPVQSSSFSELNLEGAKDDPGVRSLRTEASDFGQGQVLVIVTDATHSQLYAGLNAENMRFAGDAANSLEEVRIGGRFFAGAERGFLDGDISEVLLYDYALPNAKRISLSDYLSKKYDCVSKRIEYSLEGAWAALKSYDGLGSRLTLTPIDQAIRKSQGDASQRQDIERRLIAVLQSDAPAGAKEFACRRLIFVGTQKSVPALSKMLGDSQLGLLAQITLEAIPGDAAATALRQAADKAPAGRQLGLIQGLGLRGDRKAVPMLAALLDSSQSQVADAAAQALAQIGDPNCVAPLDAFLHKADAARRPIAFSANIMLASRLLEREHAAESAKVLLMLEPLADEAGQCAILAGLVKAQPEEAAALLFSALSGKSPRIRGEAAGLIRTSARGEAIAALAQRLAELPREGQVSFVDAVGYREPATAKPVVVQALQSKAAEVRTSAISLLGALGVASDVPLLARIAATAKSASERQAAFRSLTQLHADGTDAALIGQLQQANAALRSVAVRALAARKAYAAVEAIAKTAKDPSPSVRSETGKALQTLASEKAVGRLMQLLLEASDAAERSTFEQALIASCQKIADPGRRATPILAEYNRGSSQAQAVLLPVLGALGGARASELVHAALADPSADIYESGLRALANWPDASVVPELLTLAKNTTKDSHRAWAIRGIARVAPRPGQLPPAEAFAAMKQAFELADRLDDKKLVLTRMGAIRTPACLAYAVSKIDDAAFKAEAITTTVKLAEGMKESHPREARTAFQRVLEVTKDDALQTRINRLLGKIKP